MARTFARIVLGGLGFWMAVGMADSSLAANSPAQEPLLVIVPARPRLVQLALDLADLRPVLVMACRGDAAAKDPLLFVWSRKTWQYVSEDEFRARQFLSATPPRTALIGEAGSLPAVVEAAADWGSELIRLPTVQVADLVNRLDGVLGFSNREWKWLAARHDLELTDINEPRRQFNPYDIPRSRLPLLALPPASENVPPAVLEETPSPEPSDPTLK